MKAGGAKELTHCSRSRLGIDQVLRHHRINLDRRHTLFNGALHAEKAQAILVFHQLPTERTGGCRDYRYRQYRPCHHGDRQACVRSQGCLLCEGPHRVFHSTPRRIFIFNDQQRINHNAGIKEERFNIASAIPWLVVHLGASHGKYQ